MEQTSIPEVQPDDRVIPTAASAAPLRGLPEEDQGAIRSILGRPVVFAGIGYGQAEVEFTDSTAMNTRSGPRSTCCERPDRGRAAAGLQVIGRAFDEETVLRVGDVLKCAANF